MPLLVLGLPTMIPVCVAAQCSASATGSSRAGVLECRCRLEQCCTSAHKERRMITHTHTCLNVPSVLSTLTKTAISTDKTAMPVTCCRLAVVDRPALHVQALPVVADE
jgi:hypothetical protein